jgi:hypothetical protein
MFCVDYVRFTAADKISSSRQRCEDSSVRVDDMVIYIFDDVDFRILCTHRCIYSCVTVSMCICF